jgi:hypothetical protein
LSQLLLLHHHHHQVFVAAHTWVVVVDNHHHSPVDRRIRLHIHLDLVGGSIRLDRVEVLGVVGMIVGDIEENRCRNLYSTSSTIVFRKDSIEWYVFRRNGVVARLDIEVLF